MTPADIETGIAHLRGECEVMAALIAAHRPPQLAPVDPSRYFDVLVCSIIGQQLSVRAADTIEARLRDLIGPITPEAIIGSSDEDLRGIGLSRSKVSYSKGLAESFHSGDIMPEILRDGDDADIIAALTAVKGIGPWTAEMFLIFALARPDVWSPGDLGLRRSVEFFFASSDPAVADRWRPYRSIAAWYLWEHSDQLQGRVV